MASKAQKELELSIEDIFSGFNNFLPIFFAGLLYCLILAISALLFILPGFILGTVLLFFIPLIVLRDETIKNALIISKNIVTKYFFNNCLLFCIIVFINILGLLCFGIGVFITLPFTIVTLNVAFEETLS